MKNTILFVAIAGLLYHLTSKAYPEFTAKVESTVAGWAKDGFNEAGKSQPVRTAKAKIHGMTE